MILPLAMRTSSFKKKEKTYQQSLWIALDGNFPLKSYMTGGR